MIGKEREEDACVKDLFFNTYLTAKKNVKLHGGVSNHDTGCDRYIRGHIYYYLFIRVSQTIIKLHVYT